MWGNLYAQPDPNGWPVKDLIREMFKLEPGDPRIAYKNRFVRDAVITIVCALGEFGCLIWLLLNAASAVNQLTLLLVVFVLVVLLAFGAMFGFTDAIRAAKEYGGETNGNK